MHLHNISFDKIWQVTRQNQACTIVGRDNDRLIGLSNAKGICKCTIPILTTHFTISHSLHTTVWHSDAVVYSRKPGIKWYCECESNSNIHSPALRVWEWLMSGSLNWMSFHF